MKSVTFILTILFVVFISCQDTENEILEMRVQHHQKTSHGSIGPSILYVVQTGDEIGGEEWDAAFGITDFEYEWGYTHDILVAKDYYDEPVTDAPSFRYIFLKELFKEKVKTGTRFELILESTYDDGYVRSFFDGDKQNGFSIFGNKTFDCADLCEELTKERESYTLLIGTFEHIGDGEIRLVDLKDQYFR